VPGLFGIFEVGRRTVLAYQSAMNAVGHNVANASTPGYHRQRVELRATAPLIDAFGALGTGVRAAGVQRVENRFLEYAVQREIPTMGRYEARADALAQTELMFGEPSENGLTKSLDEFFGAWDDLASTPEDAGARESVVRIGASLADSIRSTRERLWDQRTAVNTEIQGTVDDANRVARELHRLNRSILQTGASGEIAPDLEDRRDQLVESLADLVGGIAEVDHNGTATVWVSGRVIVQAETIQEITFDLSESEYPMTGDRAIPADRLEGRLGGLIQVRDDDLEGAIGRLDEFAARLVRDVNGLHQRGVDSNGKPGGAFFEIDALGNDGVSRAAAGIRVSQALLDDSRRLAAGTTGKPGDNAIALDVAALRNDPHGFVGMLEAMIVDVGGRAREAQDLRLGQGIVLDSFRAQRESVSGVSLDEEAADLMRFQRAFQAGAQILATADEMTQTILSL
jgi:flagellar hook-associated protein 1 FlgK